MKRTIICLLCSLMTFTSLTACSNSHNEGESNNDQNNEIVETESPATEIVETDQPDVETTAEENNTEDSDYNLDESDDASLTQENANEVGNGLSQKQLNSIAMLNYLAMTTQQIESSKDNRLFLEEAYTALINNTSPDKIDKTTQDHLTNLLDIIEEYRVIDIKRERLKYLYNQDKANAIRQAIPNPIAILSVANSLDWKRLAVTVVYTAMDSYSRYKQANDEADQQYLMSGWDLDDREEENIHKNRKRAFNYMVNICRDYEIPKEFALNEEAIEDFVEATMSDNVYQRLTYLESDESKKTYETFGNYWLELADCYYEIENYSACLECIRKYKNLYTGIFRKDYSYAEILPKIIIAAQNEYSGEQYISVIEEFTKDLLQNAGSSNWALKYFAAQCYLDLYSKTGNNSYLNEAYEIALNNVNALRKEQIAINSAYLNDVVEIKYEDDPSLSKKENTAAKKQVDAYNKSLNETRKTELLSLYEPLILNCDLLFSLADIKEDFNSSDITRIEGILRTNTNGVFISKPINDKYSFGSSSEFTANLTYNLGKISLEIPVNLLIDESSIIAVVKTGDGTVINIDDWKIKEVKRPGSDINEFVAIYTSKSINSIKWDKECTVNVTVIYNDLCDPKETVFTVTEFSSRPLVPDKVVFGQK